MQSSVCRCMAMACFVLVGWGNSPTRFLPWSVACCRAQEKGMDKFRQQVEEEATKWHVGGGGFIQTEPYAGVDARVYPAPVVAYEGEHFYVRSAIVGYRIINMNGLMIGPLVQPRVEGYSAGDSPFLSGMQDRDWSIDGGVNIEAVTPVGLVGMSALSDLLGRYRGQEVEWRHMIMFPALGFEFNLWAGVRWKSEDLVNYYFGVRPNEARPGRPAYQGEQAFDPFLRLVVRHKLAEHWSLFTDTQYEWLAGAITDSPIVDKDYQVGFTAGVLYSW